MVRTFEREANYLNEDDPWKGILSATAFVVRSAYRNTLRKTPGQLVFGRDMIFNIQHVANWEFIRQNKQKVIEKNNIAKNAKQTAHLYKEGDPVLVRRGTENKYESPYRGPYNITKVKDNGTVR